MDGLRPLAVGELLDAAIKIYRGRWKTLMMAVAIPMVPVAVVTALLNSSAQVDPSIDPTTGMARTNGGELGLAFAASILAMLLSLAASALASAACFRSVSGAYLGDDVDWRESLRFAWGRIGSVLGLTTLRTLALLVGLIACCFGVLWPLTVFAVAMPAMLVEGLSAGKAMSRSQDLVKGSGWRVLGIVLLGTLLASVFQSIFVAPLAVMTFAETSEVVALPLRMVLTAVATVLVTPFTVALHMALYVDLRVRKEGFDLVLWAQRLGAAPAASFPAQPGAPATAAAGYPPVGYPPVAYPPAGYPPAAPSPYPPAAPPPYPPAGPSPFAPPVPPPPPPAPPHLDPPPGAGPEA